MKHHSRTIFRIEKVNQYVTLFVPRTKPCQNSADHGEWEDRRNAATPSVQLAPQLPSIVNGTEFAMWESAKEALRSWQRWQAKTRGDGPGLRVAVDLHHGRQWD